MNAVVVSGAAAWIAGRWITCDADLAPWPGVEGARAELDISEFKHAPRIARADRLTRLVAMTAARALLGLPDPSTPESRSVIVASTLASSHTNEAFEQRRLRTGRPVPRDFSYTAPNAAAGELAAAILARGPSLSLVGGMEAGLVAVERAFRWVQRGECERAVVVAAECPPLDASIVAPPGTAPVECAAALVLERSGQALHSMSVSASWLASARATSTPWGPLLSAALPASLVVAWSARADTDVSCTLPGGASVSVSLRH